MGLTFLSVLDTTWREHRMSVTRSLGPRRSLPPMQYLISRVFSLGDGGVQKLGTPRGSSVCFDGYKSWFTRACFPYFKLNSSQTDWMGGWINTALITWAAFFWFSTGPTLCYWVHRLFPGRALWHYLNYRNKTPRQPLRGILRASNVFVTTTHESRFVRGFHIKMSRFQIWEVG